MNPIFIGFVDELDSEDIGCNGTKSNALDSENAQQVYNGKT